MTPKLTFRRSSIYDRVLEPLRSKSFKPHPQADKIIQQRIGQLEKVWSQWDKKLLGEMARVTGLSWSEKQTVCYVVLGVRSFSDPLTINVGRPTMTTLHTLTHEMIHRLITDPKNRAKFARNWASLVRPYKKESPSTHIHLFVFAIHEHLLRKFFSEKALETEKANARSQDYLRAWEIVSKVGYKQVIERFAKILSDAKV